MEFNTSVHPDDLAPLQEIVDSLNRASYLVTTERGLVLALLSREEPNNRPPAYAVVDWDVVGDLFREPKHVAKILERIIRELGFKDMEQA